MNTDEVEKRLMQGFLDDLASVMQAYGAMITLHGKSIEFFIVDGSTSCVVHNVDHIGFDLDSDDVLTWAEDLEERTKVRALK